MEQSTSRPIDMTTNRSGTEGIHPSASRPASTNKSQREARCALLAILLVTLVAAACARSRSSIAIVVNPTIEQQLESLGDLASADRITVSQTFTNKASSLSVGSGISFVAPAGAFRSETDVTVQVVDLRFESYISDAPDGAIYLTSTTQHVELDTPVFLEILKPSNSVTVLQFIDDMWMTIDVPEGQTTKIPIHHFSTVATAVVDLIDARAEARWAQSPADSDATFLKVCVVTVDRMLRGNLYDPTLNRLAGDLALSTCTRALISRNTPFGERVTTSCVGRKIGGKTDLQLAIKECLADQDSDTKSEVSSTKESSAAAPRNDEAESEDGAAEDSDEPVAESDEEYCQLYQSFLDETAPWLAELFNDGASEADAKLLAAITRWSTTLSAASPVELEAAWDETTNSLSGFSTFTAWADSPAYQSAESAGVLIENYGQSSC